MARWLWMLPGLVACGGFANAYTASSAIAEARCERVFSCESTYPSDAETPFADAWGASVEECEQRGAADPGRKSAWRDAEKSGALTYNKVDARACVVGLGLQACEAFWTDPDPAGCALAMQGTVARNGECNIDAACASGLCDGGRCIGGTDVEEED
ncbi:MAG: hypothetical protein AB8H79_12350 [Myxococcota bacterium]